MKNILLIFRSEDHLALFTSQNQKLINMENKILLSPVNFKLLLRHSHHLNSLFFCRL